MHVLRARSWCRCRDKKHGRIVNIFYMVNIMSKVKIISDGTPIGTKVFVNDEVMEGVTKIEIHLIDKINGMITSKITLKDIKEAEIESYLIPPG